MVTINLVINTPSSSIDSINSCSDFTWIDGITYTSSNSIATYVLANAAGCDSVINLDLIISPLNNAVTSLEDTLFALETGAIYQWLNCDSGYSTITGESNISFTPVSNGNYAVEINNGICIDTSSCEFIGMNEIVENDFSFKLFPNPTHSDVNLRFKDNSWEIISVYTIQGRLMAEFPNFNNQAETTITLPDIAGTYLIRVQTSTQVYWQETIKL